MAITFAEEKKNQKRLLLFFGFLLTVLVLILIQGLLKKISVGDNEGVVVTPVFKKANIDFTILENQALKDLEPFEGIKPFDGRTGRENPFVSY